LKRTDKLCLALLLWFVAGLADWAMDAAAYRAAEADKPPLEITWEAPMEEPCLVEAVALQLEPNPYREDVPLDRELQAALRESCEDSGVPVALALGLIETESGFRPDAVSGEGAYGLCQLNPRYFAAGLTPAENIRAGMEYLGELLERYGGDTQAALCAYNCGHDTDSRTYANTVLAAAGRWEDQVCVKSMQSAR